MKSTFLLMIEVCMYCTVDSFTFMNALRWLKPPETHYFTSSQTSCQRIKRWIKNYGMKEGIVNKHSIVFSLFKEF
jgi:hypothetical protein